MVEALLVLLSGVIEHESVFLHRQDGLDQELVEDIDLLSETR